MLIEDPKFHELLERARKWCSIQERCHQDTRDKLYKWGLHKEQVEQAIAQLISEKFLNEERYARAFARGKFRMKKWGRVKITYELKKHKISEYCIRKGLSELDDKEYKKVLLDIINRKSKEIRETNNLIKMRRTAAYAISRGFESELVWQLLREK